ncbi:MAG: NADH-quinone oxidoreductase subunit C [Desulfuromonadales bacterium]|nr:NADH-quinone oxidoreductase subunit C [Desulfuromonadales bacterium]
MDTVQTLIHDLSGLPAVVRQVEYRTKGFHLELELALPELVACTELLRTRDFYLVFISAVHLDPVITVIYQFASFQYPCRIMVRLPVDAECSVPSIAPIFDGANWHERETRDMFGVLFRGHPYLEPLLLAEEDAELKPLLKRGGALKTAENIGWAAASDQQRDVEP